MRFWPPRSTVGIEVMFTVPCHKCREWQHCRLQMAGKFFPGLFLADSVHSFFGQSGYFPGRQGGAISWIAAAWGLVSINQVKFLLWCVCITNSCCTTLKIRANLLMFFEAGTLHGNLRATGCVVEQYTLLWHHLRWHYRL